MRDREVDIRKIDAVVLSIVMPIMLIFSCNYTEAFIDDNSIQKSSITVTNTANSLAEISNGFKPGDRTVTNDRVMLADSDKILLQDTEGDRSTVGQK